MCAASHAVFSPDPIGASAFTVAVMVKLIEFPCVMVLPAHDAFVGSTPSRGETFSNIVPSKRSSIVTFVASLDPVFSTLIVNVTALPRGMDGGTSKELGDVRVFVMTSV